MTVEIEYTDVDSSKVRLSQLDMAKQIEANAGFPIGDLTRRLEGNTLIIQVQTSLPNQAVENMLSDIEEHINSEAQHIETRKV